MSCTASLITLPSAMRTPEGNIRVDVLVAWRGPQLARPALRQSLAGVLLACEARVRVPDIQPELGVGQPRVGAIRGEAREAYDAPPAGS